MSKRVLFWCERFWPAIGGVGLTAARLLPALKARGWEFVVLTLKENADLPEEDTFEGMRVCRWPLWTAISSRDPAQMFSIRKRVAALKRDFAPDLIHIDFLGSSTLFHVQTTDVHVAPVLVSMDSAFLEGSRDRNSLAGRVLTSADWVTCVSEFTLAEIHEALPEIVPKSSCILHGRPLPDVEVHPAPATAPRILCLGRLVPSKGFDVALSAFGKIVDRYPGARLLIGGDGPDREALQRQIADEGLEDNVEMLGWIEPDDVPELMNTVTLVVVPSRTEVLPNVAKEAALMARPVIATRTGGMAEVVEDRRTGLLVAPDDDASLAEAMAYLLDRPDEAAEMGRRARIHVAEVFDFQKYVGAYETLYTRLIHSGRPT